MVGSLYYIEKDLIFVKNRKMEIKYKNYTITRENSCYALRETWIVWKGKNKWEEFEKAVIYPSTMEKTLERIIERELIVWNKTMDLKDMVKEFTEIYDKFIIDLTEISKWLELHK